MSLDSAAFETIVPRRYITFTFPNPLPPPLPHLLHSPFLRVAVLDSPSSSSSSTTTTTTTTTSKAEIAALLVPPNRERDWTFSTQTGHLQLLFTFPQLSRLILISNNGTTTDGFEPTSYKSLLSSDTENSAVQIEANLMPLLLALTPKSAFDQNGRFPDIPFLSYEDEVISSLILEICDGPCVGEMMVENVELQMKASNGREFRRRLRFKRMPNLIQTQVRIHPIVALDAGDQLEGVEFRVDNVLVQPYLSPMVAGLSLISSCLDERIRMGFRPKALCLGIGGGALVEFLSSKLEFEVVGVEEDEVVLSLAKKYFGLKEGELVQLCIGDGIKSIQNLAFKEKYHDLELLNGCTFKSSGCLDHVDGKFDVIMVDLDSSDAVLGSIAPPLEFVRKSVLLAVKRVVLEHGVVVINVIVANKSFYEMVTSECQEVFEDLYEIDVGNEENLVLVASPSEIGTACNDYDNSFLQKLKSSIQGSHMNSLRKITGVSVPKKL